ncbi:MAG TPA: lipid A-modifier LpxR family protein, partial [Chitinophagaceae bacterium]|nr:lipid A-modifier LpxR family protein [Chitinophagaceae bacterium]
MLRVRMISGMLLATMMFRPAFAQHQHPHFSREISIISDNDNYTLQRRDGYYTNGFNLSFRQLLHTAKPNVEKSILRAEIGQMIFNPYKYSIVDPEQMDRPFAGYLFAKVSKIKFFRNASSLEYGISAGLLGKASGGQSFQRSYHKLINIYEVRGWDYQLKSEPSLNLHLQYARSLFNQPAKNRGIDVHTVGKANLGTAFTNA